MLIVEDHPLVREGLAALLSIDGRFEVCGSVGSAREALELARTERPRLALVDLRLSDGDSGLGLIRQLCDAVATTTVVVVSGQDPEVYEEAARGAGAVAFIRKRDINDRLLSTLGEILD